MLAFSILVLIGGHLARQARNKLPSFDIADDVVTVWFIKATFSVVGMLAIPIAVPYLLMLFIWPPWLREEFPERPWITNSATSDAEARLAWRMHFRIVTRGKNPSLVASNCRELWTLCESICLKHYTIEVVTDNRIECASRSGAPVDEVVVPDSYVSQKFTKWKARALQYALETVSAGKEDWVVHLDEETKVDERCITGIWLHAEREREAVQNGERKYPDLGQGAILYGKEKHGPMENWFTTLADSIRVSDDFGSFRCSFLLRDKFTVGMKGSFVVMQQSVGEIISWDVGPKLSLTEDAAFNMIAHGKYNIGTAWIDAFMYEQSPFSIKDLMRQRERWYTGLCMCVMANETSSRKAFAVPFKLACWTLTPMTVLAWFMALFTNTIPLSIEYPLFIYTLGFLMTFSPEDGWRRFLKLLCLQWAAMPLFQIIEMLAVLAAVRESWSGKWGKEFHIVEKESTQAKLVERATDKQVDQMKVALLAA
jgi:egghead protein (zeste-white 4 protein)